MLDHVFLSVSDTDRSIRFDAQVLAPLGIVNRLDDDGRDGPPVHPDLKGFGANGRLLFWLRQGTVDARSAHVGFVASSRAAAVDAAYVAAMAAGATDKGGSAVRPHHDPRYHAANVLEPDGYSLEFFYKSWQHDVDANDGARDE